MKKVAVATLKDPGAAEVAAAALAEAGLDVEVRRIGMVPHFGTLTGADFEVRVPPSEVDDAVAVLEHLEEESRAALVAEAPGEHPADHPEAHVKREPPSQEPRSRTLGLALSLLVPVVGPVYAGRPDLAFASAFVHAPLFAELAQRATWHHGFHLGAFAVACWLLGRCIDVAGTMQAIRRRNAVAATPHLVEHTEADDAPVA